MSRRNNQFRLMSQIGNIPEKYIEEAEYTKKERARLEKHDAFAKVIRANRPGEETSSAVAFVEEDRTSDTYDYKEAETTRKNNILWIIRIAASVSIVAAGLLLFVFLWNPERGHEPATTTSASEEQTTSEEYSSENVEPTEESAFVFIATREADIEPVTTQATEDNTPEPTTDEATTAAPVLEEPTTATIETPPPQEQQTEEAASITECAEGEHTLVWMTVKEPTCLTEGEKIYTCTVCGKIVQKETIVGGGHEYVVFLTSKDPTCTEEGMREYRCKYCNSSMRVTTPPLGHTSTDSQYCDRCGEYIGNDTSLPDDD